MRVHVFSELYCCRVSPLLTLAHKRLTFLRFFPTRNNIFQSLIRYFYFRDLELKRKRCVHAFTEALLPTVVFPKRFSFFTVCLVQWLRGVTSLKTPKGKCFNFRSADHWKMHFFWNFRVSWGGLKKG